MSDKQWFDHIAKGQPRQTMSNKQIDEALDRIEYYLPYQKIGGESVCQLADEVALLRQALERQRVPDWPYCFQPGDDGCPGWCRNCGRHSSLHREAMLAAAPEIDES